MRVRPFLFFVVLASLATVSAPKNSKPTTPPGTKAPNVILITLDTTRADRMGFLGSTRGLTPNLDALARQSVVFTRAYAQVPLTSPSHAALLTGTYPQFNHLEVLGDSLRSDLPYVPELLRQHGYRTAAFVGSMILDPASGAPGFDRGFDTYDAGFHLARPGEDRYSSVERRAEVVASRALGWLSNNQQKPFFIWLHFYDPHDPYDPPGSFKARYNSAPYDGEIAYTDSIVGKVLEALKGRGLFENCLIAIAADHGEAFGEHGEKRHGLLLFDETIHVPLLLKLPAEKFAGKRIETRVSLIDLAPLLLQAAHVSVPPTMQAQSLLSLIEPVETPTETLQVAGAQSDGPKRSERAIYSESDYAHRTLGWSELRSWRTGKYLYVRAPSKELYDQAADPGALRNIAPTANAVADTLDAQLVDFRQKTSGGSTDQIGLDSAQAENLHALGYMASDRRKEDRVDKPLVDPKDKVEVANLLQEALVALEESRYDDAVAQVRKAIRDPDAVNAYLEFGTALVNHKQYQNAIPLLREAVEKLPDSAGARYELGIALINTGQWEAALPEMQAAVALKPDSASLHFNLAAVNTRLKHVTEAMSECEKALEIDPDHFDANLTYGKLLLMQGRPDAALPRLEHAIRVKPGSAEAHFFLAEGYQKLGETENATHERQIVNELKSRAPN
jgi:choline-sulfatase